MKAKTKSSAKKRIEVRKSGTLKMEKIGKRHLLTRKSKSQKRKGRTHIKPDSTLQTMIVRVLPGVKKNTKKKVQKEVKETK